MSFANWRDSMNSMTRTLRAHFDGKVIVPDSPVDLPLNEPFEVTIKQVTKTQISGAQFILAAKKLDISKQDWVIIETATTEAREKIDPKEDNTW